MESAAHREAGRVFDPRAMHFYDAEAKLGKLFAEVIHLPGGVPAWDVYFVYAPAVRWEARPPTPTYWMHQLGNGPSELRLDGRQIAHVINGLLATVGRASTQAGRTPPKLGR